MLLWSAPPPARTPSCVASTPKVESGAAPAGVAKVATEAAPVKRGDGEKTTAIDFHDPAPMRTRSRQFKSRARKSVPRWHRSGRLSTCDSVNAAAVSQWEQARVQRGGSVSTSTRSDGVGSTLRRLRTGGGGRAHVTGCAHAPALCLAIFQEFDADLRCRSATITRQRRRAAPSELSARMNSSGTLSDRRPPVARLPAKHRTTCIRALANRRRGR